MAYQLDSFKNFNNALEEVSLLIELASEFENLSNKYAALNKSGLLLLTAKFEVFVEDVVREYIEEINLMKLTLPLISNHLKMKHSITRIKEIIEIIENPKKDEKRIEIFKEIAKLWSEQEHEVFDDLNIPNKFNYGKHGSKELEKLFRNIEIENIFETIIIYTDKEDSILDSAEEIDLKAIINNITNLRNKISHQDQTPNITHKDLKEFVDHLNRFSKDLCEYLERNLHSLAEQYETFKQVATDRDTAS